MAFTFVNNYSENVSKDYLLLNITLTNKCSGKVIMKLLLSLLLIISITIVSWSSSAKNTVIHANSIYLQPTSATHSMVLMPSLSNQYVSEDYAFTVKQNVHKSHNFFELAIIFNEKLQQFIAFFTHIGDEVDELVSEEFAIAVISPDKHMQTVNKKCTTSN